MDFIVSEPCASSAFYHDDDDSDDGDDDDHLNDGKNRDDCDGWISAEENKGRACIVEACTDGEYSSFCALWLVRNGHSDHDIQQSCVWPYCPWKTRSKARREAQRQCCSELAQNYYWTHC